MFKIIGVGSGVLIAVSALIQISPININPWTHIARAIGRAINGELTDKITRLESNVTALTSSRIIKIYEECCGKQTSCKPKGV